MVRVVRWFKTGYLKASGNPGQAKVWAAALGSRGELHYSEKVCVCVWVGVGLVVEGARKLDAKDGGWACWAAWCSVPRRDMHSPGYRYYTCGGKQATGNTPGTNPHAGPGTGHTKLSNWS